MRRFTHLTLALGTVVLLALLLFLAMDAQPTALAVGGTIKVPDDYPTIQGAIDAATDGDEIMVAFGTYPENLSITKGITLSGSWSADFTYRTGRSVIDGRALGRVISITCVTSDTVVTVDGFVVENGDATGLSEPATQVGTPRPPASLLMSDIPQAAQAADPRSPTEQMAELKAHLADVVARGLYPGGEDTYQTLLAQLDWLTAQAVMAHTRAGALHVAAPDDPPQVYDFGGGIFSHNASLHLLNNIIRNNTASRQNNGVGGGVYVGQAAPGGVIIHDNDVNSNVASAGNVREVLGLGGGLYIDHAPGAVVKWNQFYGNHGAEAGLDSVGFGGAIMIWSSPAPDLNFNEFGRNTANLAWDGQSGVGGALYLRRVNGAVLHDNIFNSNLAGFRGGGGGGGLFLSESEDVFVTKNNLDSNVACVFQNTSGALGGGIALKAVNDSTLDGNDLWGNTACVNCMRTLEMPNRGGGLYGEELEDIKLTDNQFHQNIGAQTSQARGGGAFILGSSGTVLSENEFTGNVASTSHEFGTGGGLCLEGTTGSEIRSNDFVHNRGGTGTAGSGGGLALSISAQPNMNVTVEANSFVENSAAAGPNDGDGGAFVDYLTQGLIFRNNVVDRNAAGEGGGIELIVTRQGQVINNTLVGNTDSGVLVSNASVELVNNIVVNHTVGLSVAEGSSATVSYTLWDGNDTDIGGGGTISETHPVYGDPAFIDHSNNDYHLAVGSPAIDAGDPAGVPPAPDHDYDGVARPQGMAVDIGAYEWQGHYQYLPLVMNKRRPGVGWAVGDASLYGEQAFGTILHTTDGGSTWTRQGSAAEVPNVKLNEVSAVNDQNAWVVGAYAILRTRDGGQTWETQTLPNLPEGYELQGIKALDENNAYVVGTPSILLQTTDGGTWSQMPVGDDVPDNIGFQVVDAVDAQHVWAVGSIGDRTKPVIAFYNGVEWHLQPIPAFSDPDTSAFIGISAIDQFHAWTVGGESMPLVITSDGGGSWQTAGQPLLVGEDMNRVVAVSATTGWVAGDYGRVQYTTDAGTTWDGVNLPSEYLFGVTAMDDKTAWVVGPGDAGLPPGIIARTRDAQNWEVQSYPSWPNMNGISFVGARR